jgi:hypothetical protein
MNMNTKTGLILCVLCGVSSATYTMFEGPGSCCEEGIINPGFGIVKKQTDYPAYPASYQNVVNTVAFTRIQNERQNKPNQIIIPAAYEHLFKDLLYEVVPFEIFFKFLEKSKEASEK